MKKQKQAFTLIELVVAATILVVLTSIGFYTYTQNISDARDSSRNTDIAALESQMNLYKNRRWAYPFPDEYFEITNRWYTVAYQGLLTNKVALKTTNRVPRDPDLDRFYSFSVTNNRQEYQIGLSLENNDDPFARVWGDYKSVSRNVLPSILLATGSTSPVEINVNVTADGGDENRNLFILDTWYHTLPYDFDLWDPYTDGSSFDDILNDVWDNFVQNTDFVSCSEIYIAKKHINTPNWVSSDEYNVRNSSWALVDISCTFP